MTLKGILVVYDSITKRFFVHQVQKPKILSDFYVIHIRIYIKHNTTLYLSNCLKVLPIRNVFSMIAFIVALNKLISKPKQLMNN